MGQSAFSALPIAIDSQTALASGVFLLKTSQHPRTGRFEPDNDPL